MGLSKSERECRFLHCQQTIRPLAGSVNQSTNESPRHTGFACSQGRFIDYNNGSVAFGHAHYEAGGFEERACPSLHRHAPQNSIPAMANRAKSPARCPAAVAPAITSLPIAFDSKTNRFHHRSGRKGGRR